MESNRPFPELLKALLDLDKPENVGKDLDSLLSQKEISTLLQNYPLSDSESMFVPPMAPEKIFIRRLGALRLRARLSQIPFYAESERISGFATWERLARSEAV